MAQPCHPACGAVAVPGAKRVSLPQVTWPLLRLQKDEGLRSSLGRAGGWPGSRFRPNGSGQPRVAVHRRQLTVPPWLPAPHGSYLLPIAGKCRWQRDGAGDAPGR